jgi:hypothetical protein
MRNHNINLNRKLLLFFALLSSFIFTGCVNWSEFHGMTRNLRGEGNLTSDDTPLKLKVSSSGNTIHGGNYLALYLPQEKCLFIMFYPKIKPLGDKALNPYPDYTFRAEIETNYVRAWQTEGVWRGSNAVTTNIDLPEGYTAVWLVRGKPLRRSVLELGGGCPTNAEPLFGKIAVTKDGDYHILAELSNNDGTKISGSFDSDKGLWAPIGLPLAGVVIVFMWIFDIRD